MLKKTLPYRFIRGMYLAVCNYGLHPSRKPKSKMSFDQLSAVIDRLEINQDDCLFVYHSVGNLGLDFNPNALIESLQEKVGENGNIIMLATPFLGRTTKYLENEPVFNVMRDPCRTGLLSEIFRRKSGVHRTMHPLSSNCIWGKNARELSKRQKNFEYAYSEESLYGYGDTVNAKVMGLGVDVHESLSPMHYFEYLKKDVYPVYTREKFKVRLKTDKEDFDLFAHALNSNTQRHWRKFKKAINRQPGSIHFIARDRAFYAYRYSALKSVIFDLMEKKQYFKKI